MLAKFIYSASYLVTFLFMLSGIWTAYKLFREHHLTWGQARVMGVTAAIFGWMQMVFYLALFNGGFSVISFFADLPFWIDFLMAGIIIIAVTFIYRSLSQRTTFNKAMFIALFAVPLGFPSASIVSKLTKIGMIEVSEKIGFFYVKKYRDDAKGSIKITAEITKEKIEPDSK
jgi:hypothetical protein